MGGPPGRGGGDIRAKEAQLKEVALILERRAKRAAFPRGLAEQLETLSGGKYAAAAKERLVPAPIRKTLFGGQMSVTADEGGGYSPARARAAATLLDPKERMWLERTDPSPLSPAKREVDDDDRDAPCPSGWSQPTDGMWGLTSSLAHTAGERGRR